MSVVATGIDAAVAPRSAAPQEARIAEATQRIRAEVPRANQEADVRVAPTPMTRGGAAERGPAATAESRCDPRLRPPQRLRQR